MPVPDEDINHGHDRDTIIHICALITHFDRLKFLKDGSSFIPLPSLQHPPYLFNSDKIRVTSWKSIEAPYQAIAMIHQMRNLYKPVIGTTHLNTRRAL